VLLAFAVCACHGGADGAAPTPPTTASPTQAPTPADPAALVLRAADLSGGRRTDARTIPRVSFLPCGPTSQIDVPEARGAEAVVNTRGDNVSEAVYAFPDAAAAHARVATLITALKSCPTFPRQVTVGGKHVPDVVMRRRPYPGLRYGDESYVYSETGTIPGIGLDRMVFVVARVGAVVVDVSVDIDTERDDAAVDAAARAAVERARTG
jgi:hypothetical protein